MNLDTPHFAASHGSESSPALRLVPIGLKICTNWAGPCTEVRSCPESTLDFSTPLDGKIRAGKAVFVGAEADGELLSTT